MYRMKRCTLSLVSALLVALLAAPAAAQAPSFQVESFEPLPIQRTNILNVAKSDVLPHLQPAFGVFFHYVDEPLRLVDRGDDSIASELVASQFKAEFYAGVGLFEYADIGLVVPTVLYQNGGEFQVFGQPGQSIESVALVDARLVPKVRVPMPEALDNFGVAFLSPVYLPIGDEESFNSDGTVRVEPRLALDWRDNGFVVAANAAYQIRPETVAHNYVSDDALRWAVAGEAPIGFDSVGGVARNPRFIASLFGTVQLSDDVDPADPGRALDESVGSPMELQAAIRAGMPLDLSVIVGGGAGLNGDIGAPSWRLFTSIGYASTDRDRDEDGFTDLEDSCPDNPEDPDGFRDADGCPDPDNDGDEIADVDDACPMEAEDVDSFEDTDGCPDPDNDGDKIADADDECPLEAEDLDGYVDDDGCPDPDNDGDEIADVDDQCPDEPGVAEMQGCPNPDPDGDGIVNADDACPQKAEDKDNFEDTDGCPDLDNDGDGFADSEDLCPDDAEVVNGVDDKDGCPDAKKVRVTQEKIEILEKVYFDTGKATIKTRSYELLNEVAQILKDNPRLAQIRVEGHTDSRGSASYNRKLSQKRAEAVEKYLVAQGVEASRLQAKGFGEDTPIADNDTDEGRARNRRVEFTIMERSGE